MARRAKGEGSIHTRKDGRIAGSFPTGDGKRKYVYGKTKKEVAAKLRAEKAAYERGEKAVRSTETTGDYLAWWVQVYAPPMRKWKPLTQMSYAYKIEQAILPFFAEKKLSDIRRDLVQTWIAHLACTYAARSVRKFFSIFHTALADALDLGKIAANPATHVKLPKLERYHAQVLDEEQAPRLLKVAADSRIECLLIMALATGMRLGELRALRWSDLDVEKKRLQVARNVAYVKRDGKYGYLEGTPKSEAGTRDIILPGLALEALRVHRLQQHELRWKSAKWQEKDLIFPNRVGSYFNADSLRKYLKDLLKEAGYQTMRFHDLRHTAATLLIAMGVDPVTIKELLGHANVATTLQLYPQATRAMKQDAADKVDRLYQRGKSG